MITPRDDAARKRQGTHRLTGEHGFSLVEVLAAITITAIMASLVVLSLPRSGDGRRVGEVLAARVQVAVQESIVSGTVIGLKLDEGGYAFQRYRAGVWSAVVEPATLGAGAWPPTALVSFDVEGAPEFDDLTEDEIAALPPLVRFDPTGMATPFTVSIDDEVWLDVVAVTRGGAVTLESARDD